AERFPHAARVVLAARVEIVEELDLDAGGLETPEPAAVHERVGVAGADDDARNPRGDDGIGAGRRPAVVRARLERHVEGRALGPIAGLLQRDRLGVADSVVLVPALADDLAVVLDDRADERMIRGLPPSALGQLERPLEVAHARSRTRPSYACATSSPPKTAEPATRSSAPASFAERTLSGPIPPST